MYKRRMSTRMLESQERLPKGEVLGFLVIIALGALLFSLVAAVLGEGLLR